MAIMKREFKIIAISEGIQDDTINSVLILDNIHYIVCINYIVVLYNTPACCLHNFVNVTCCI